MTAFVLVPGAGGAGTVYWSEVVAELEARGHVGLAVEIAGNDPALGLPEYSAITDEVIGEHRDVVLVAQSMGGFTVPMIGKLDQVARIVLLNAMIPDPGETPGQWFAHVGSDEARIAAAEARGYPSEYDDETYFLHDIPADVVAAMADGDRGPADTPFGQPCTFETWPDIPTHVLTGADDRMFTVDLQVRVSRERLGLEADVIRGGHLVAKSRPVAVAERLIGYVGEVPFELADAAEAMRDAVSAVRDDQLDVRTPCEQWAVRDLLAHIDNFTRAFTRIARHEERIPPPERSELPDGWREQLSYGLDELVGAWRVPQAWDGTASAAGVTSARSEWAVVALDELVLHGWDLATATGQPFVAAADDVRICTGFAEAVAGSGADGLFGPAVDIAAAAAPLDRLLALTGREPDH